MDGKCVSTAILVTLLTGCAQMIWVKPGNDADAFRKDRYECEKDSRQSGYYGDGLVGALNMQDFFKRCMESKGYTQRKMEPGETLIVK